MNLNRRYSTKFNSERDKPEGILEATRKPTTISRPHFLVRALRSEAHAYSLVCRTRLAYSRCIAAWSERRQLSAARALFRMNEIEKRHCQELAVQGFSVLPSFFPVSLIDRIFERADRSFLRLEIDPQQAYSVQNRLRPSLEGLDYATLAATEKMISLLDPLVSVPECVQIALNASVLKIVSNFLGFLPPWFKSLIVRDFPLERPRESSNFHRDNDEADSVQAFTYLVDIDDFTGPLVYVPATNHYDVRSCRPRLSRDLGIAGADGRVGDQEIEKYYPRESWTVLKVPRGSVAIVHGNGFHKGPSWRRYGDTRNQARTAIRLDFQGHKIGRDMRWKRNRIRASDYTELTDLQKLFVDPAAVTESAECERAGATQD